MNLFAPAYLDFPPDWHASHSASPISSSDSAALCWLPYNLQTRGCTFGWAGHGHLLHPFVGFIAFLVWFLAPARPTAAHANTP